MASKATKRIFFKAYYNQFYLGIGFDKSGWDLCLGFWVLSYDYK